MGKFAQKGTRVLVRGRLVVDPQSGGPRIFSRKDGTQSASFEVTADTVRVISGYKQDEQQETVQLPQTTQPKHTVDDVDIPF